jgi:hypothetical protein
MSCDYYTFYWKKKSSISKKLTYPWSNSIVIFQLCVCVFIIITCYVKSALQVQVIHKSDFNTLYMCARRGCVISLAVSTAELKSCDFFLFNHLRLNKKGIYHFSPFFLSLSICFPPFSFSIMSFYPTSPTFMNDISDMNEKTTLW